MILLMIELSICSDCFVISDKAQFDCPSCGGIEIIATTDANLHKTLNERLCPRCLGELAKAKVQTETYSFECKECGWGLNNQVGSWPPTCHSCQTEMDLVNKVEVCTTDVLICETCSDSYEEKLYSRKPRIRLNSDDLIQSVLASLRRSISETEDDDMQKETVSKFYTCDLCSAYWQGGSNHCPECDTIVPISDNSIELNRLAKTSEHHWAERQKRAENKLVQVILVLTVISLLIFIVTQ